MSSLLHPAGSQPPEVYWRRRAAVLAALAVVIAIVVIIVWPKAGPEAAPMVTPSEQTTAAASPAASATPSVTASATPSPTKPTACDPASLRVGLAGFDKLAVGAAQPFKVSITNTAATPCVLASSSKNLTVAVTSGKDAIWTTADCAAWVPSSTVTLAPQQARIVDVAWPGTRSKPTCKTTKSALSPGTYVAKATLSGATPARLVMLISAG